MKAARLLSILSRLQARGSATAAELAALHEVSVRTIYRDIDALSAAGFPVYGDAGPGGGFRLLDVASQRVTALAGAEVEAMLLIGLPGPAAALGLGAAVESARDKLLLRLSGAAQERAERLGLRFHLDTTDWYRSVDALPQLPLLARAVLDEQQISFVYDSWTQRREWVVDPLGVVLKGGVWYLVARADQGTLTFRVAAMTRISATDIAFVRPGGFDLPRWWQQALRDFEERLRPHMARLLLTEAGARRLAESGAYAAHAVAAGQLEAEGLLVQLPYENSGQAARLILSLGAECLAIDPPEVREAVQAMAIRIADMLAA